MSNVVSFEEAYKRIRQEAVVKRVAVRFIMGTEAYKMIDCRLNTLMKDRVGYRENNPPNPNIEERLHGVKLDVSELLPDPYEVYVEYNDGSIHLLATLRDWDNEDA